MLKQFDYSERNASMNSLMSKLNKMLRSRERTNRKDFIFATEYERILWVNVTHEYEKSTPIFPINVITTLYDYFSKELIRYAHINEKLMTKVCIIHGSSNVDEDTFFKIEQNDGSITTTYIEIFKKDSGVGVRISPIAGRRLTLKNNMILEGEKIKDGF